MPTMYSVVETNPRRGTRGNSRCRVSTRSELKRTPFRATFLLNANCFRLLIPAAKQTRLCSTIRLRDLLSDATSSFARTVTIHRRRFNLLGSRIAVNPSVTTRKQRAKCTTGIVSGGSRKAASLYDDSGTLGGKKKNDGRPDLPKKKLPLKNPLVTLIFQPSSEHCVL